MNEKKVLSEGALQDMILRAADTEFAARSREDVICLVEALRASQERVKELVKAVEAAKLLDERWLLVYQDKPDPDGVQNVRLEFWRLVEALKEQGRKAKDNE